MTIQEKKAKEQKARNEDKFWMIAGFVTIMMILLVFAIKG
jgi:hypothetical protein